MDLRLATRGLGRRGIALAMGSVMPVTIERDVLAAITGGAAPQNQDQLRAMAQKWCPQTFQRYANQSTLTRRMGEQCLAEAGLSQYSSQLDKYFPRGGAK